MQTYKFASAKKILLLFLIYLSFSGYCQSAKADNATNVPDTKQDVTAKSQDTQAPLQGRAVVFDLKSDKLDYYDDKNIVVATGSAQVEIKEQNSKLYADKITFDQNTNIVIAENNVKLYKEGKVIKGSYARFDLNKESALINDPDMQVTMMKVNAKTANVYSKNLEAFKGRAVLTKEDGYFKLSSSRNLTGFDRLRQDEDNKNTSDGQHFSICAKDIQVDRKQDIDVITMRHATITIKKLKIASIPYLQFSTERDSNQVETMLPEFGRTDQLGYFIGPGYVFNLPYASTLKVAPLLALHGKKSDIGFGGRTRFTSKSNITELGYTTVDQKIVLSGIQKLGQNTLINYGANDYVDNGFFGRVLAAKIAEVVDNRKLGSAMNFDMFLRSSAGYAEDYGRDWGTTKFQLQGTMQTHNPLINIHKGLLSLGAIAQGDINVYGTGKTQGVLRAGPIVSSKAGPLYLSTMFLEGGIYGQTPFLFDRYVQGKSTMFNTIEFKLNHYITLGYFNDLNLTKDSWDHKMLQENQLYAWVGPDDIKFRIGYDTIRKRSMFGFDLLMGSGKSGIDFDKLKINDYTQE